MVFISFFSSFIIKEGLYSGNSHLLNSDIHSIHNYTQVKVKVPPIMETGKKHV